MVEAGLPGVAVDPGAAVVLEGDEVAGSADVGAGPNWRVKVIPSVVMANGPELEDGNVIVSEPMIITLDPKTMVLLPTATVELVGPNVNVVPSKTIWVTDDTGAGVDVSTGTEVLGAAPGWKVSVMLPVVTTTWPVVEAGTAMVCVPITTSLVPRIIVWPLLVIVELWAPAGSVNVVPLKTT